MECKYNVNWQTDNDIEECIVTAFINGYSSKEAEECQENSLCTNPICYFIPDPINEFYIV
jgi:hypothetical protein